MASHLSWIDFSENDRRTMLNIISMFSGKETLDELGIGSVRDAFADRFFPGTSTIHTRAKYMLFVPWAYQLVERTRLSKDKAREEVKRIEVRTIHALLESSDTSGLIGKEAKDRLQRFPSSIYWSGLYSWGIRRCTGSQSYYFERRFPRRLQRDSPPNWDPYLPPIPDEFPGEASFQLTREEAMYLMDRIRVSHPDGLLTALLEYGRPADTHFLWQQPVVGQLEADLGADVEHAKNFSETMWGATVLYNLMLAQLRDGDSPEYRDDLRQWALAIRDRWDALTRWASSPATFWGSTALRAARIPWRTRAFVENWLHLVYSGKPEGMAENEQARDLIKRREGALKWNRARLHNERARSQWSGSSGYFQLNYRWPIAFRLLNDILDGYERECDNA